MAIDLKTPEQIAEEYLEHLKGLKPEVNTKQTDSDWYVRAHVVGGVVSGVYADQRLLSDDPFPQRCRRDAMAKHLELYFDDTFKAASPASGYAVVYGATGSNVPVNMQLLYAPNGNVYQAVSAVDFGAATAVLVPILSVDSGQNQNLLSEAPLTISSPPAGIQANAMASGNISNGRDAESLEQAAARVLDRIRSPIAGGNENDYRQWALEADSRVVAANVLRFPRGLGTVGVIITAGTSNIDQALDNGEAIVLVPSDELVAVVQDYVSAKGPLTDCVTVSKPNEVSINVSVTARFSSGTKDTIPAGQTLTQGELVQREVKRAIYKTPPGGRKLGASGYVVASEIEEVIDLGLSTSPYTEGTLPILSDRRVGDLAATGPNRCLLGTELAVPGTITIVEMT